MRSAAMLWGLVTVLSAEAAAAQAAAAVPLEQAVAAWLNAAYPAAGARWEAGLLGPAPEAGEAAPAEIRLLGRLKKIAEFEAVMPDGRVLRFKAATRRMAGVAVAERVIRRNEKIREQAWRWEERDLASVPADAVRNAPEAAGKCAKKTFAAGEVLTRHGLEAEPVVRPGQRLTLALTGTGVEIKTDAQCLEKGWAGDTIKVALVGNGRVVQARVVDKDTVGLTLNPRR